MVASKRPDFIRSARSLPTDRDLEKLICEVRMTAHKKDHSKRKIDRYQTWIFGFITWCLRTSPYKVDVDQIEDFRASIERHPDAGKEEVFEAMDALAFLYGELRGPNEYLSFSSSGETSYRSPRDRPYNRRLPSSPHPELASLIIGWQEIG